MKARRSSLLAVSLAFLLSLPAGAAAPTLLGLEPADVIDVLPLAMEALAISRRAAERETKHAAELAKRGIAEVPMSDVAKYVMDAGAAGKFVFDNFGEFYIDRRFVTKDEMVTVRKIEAWLKAHFPDRAKGFGQSARPAKDRPSGFFDGWPDALRRYNGRRDRTETDRYYSDEYAEKIVRRASDPDLFVPIEIKLATSK